MIRMDKICSYCLTEPDSGSDSAALSTKAERTNEGFRVNGTKSFISGGAFSIYLAMVRTGESGPHGISAFLVEKNTKGLCFGSNEERWDGNLSLQPKLYLMIVVFPLSNY